ncbi:uncharacterized protein LOC133203508 [Saccostrea echinata]|uniref:uncharacterized protein LOC133203508 n=1 Tax=Saccostrea echinata TaxID=191078 RepID=UPI002A7F24E2|nr:uncharacterized protein LOC133203508 [Saccostrea echinata]
MRTVQSWWELVYKAVTGGPFGAYELFYSNSTRNTNNLAVQQLTNQVLDHYKSEVLNNWQSNGISKIRVSYYSGDTEAQYFVFNATGATKTDWLSRYRILETSYDISAFAGTTGKPGEYFSIDGDIAPPVIKRNFYISEGYYGCPSDQGWAMMIDGPGPCPMDWVTTTTIHYVNTTSHSLMPGLTADFMAIFVERGICLGKSAQTDNKNQQIANQTTDIEQRIYEIKTNLTVPVNSTSQYIRSKTCAEDDRMSSRAIGSVLGAGLLSFLAIFILFSDVLRVCRYFTKWINAICTKNRSKRNS